MNTLHERILGIINENVQDVWQNDGILKEELRPAANQIETLIKQEIGEAFEAGCAFTIGSHESFKQSHPNKQQYITSKL